MKYNKYLLLALLVPFLCVFCSKSENEFGAHGPFIIEFGTVCGWCAGEEKIIVSSVKIDYYKNIPCGEDQGTITKTVEISSGDWDKIISSFDYDYFLTLNYNECNVYVDGCDEFIIIIKEDSTHQIRYTPSEEIEGLDNLVQLLNMKLYELRNSD